ncbi:MAG: cytochrome c5 family protein [Gammaproteobacteria bacterium]|nr:cytochrome c5 family protein [Gammaproteobacteria bacterium]
MSDRKFLKSFSGLLGAIVALTVVLFIVANVISTEAKKAEVATADAKVVAERIKPVGELTVISSNPVMNALIPAAHAAAADGKATYDSACTACHTAGVAGAPKLGDKADWGARIAQGNATLYDHAIKGYQGKKGFMPAKGGNAALKDDAVKAAVDFMVSKSK